VGRRDKRQSLAEQLETLVKGVEVKEQKEDEKEEEETIEMKVEQEDRER